MVLRLVFCCLWLSATAEAALLRHHRRRRGLGVHCTITDAGTICSEVDDCPLGSLSSSPGCGGDDDGNGDLDSVASESKDGLKPGAIAAIVLSVLFLLFFVPAIAILIKRRTSKQKAAAAESNCDNNAENASQTNGETSTNKPEDAKNPWWGGSRRTKSPSDTDTVSADEGKPNSNEVDSSWWPSWTATDADPKSAKKEDIETPNKKNGEIVETSSSWWNACSIFS